MSLTLVRCRHLPTPLAAETIYMVKATEDAYVTLYITGKTAGVVFHTIAEEDVNTIIQNHIQENGSGIVTVDFLPDAQEHAGELYCLKGSNKPCWSNGSSWVDLAKASSPTSGGSLDDALLKRLRNELQFGIKLI